MSTTSSTAHTTTSHPTTMQAVVQDRYGDADVLRLAHVARPVVRDHEVLVRVHAAGLDRGTWHLMTGRPYLAPARRSGCVDPGTRCSAGTWPARSSRPVRR